MGSGKKTNSNIMLFWQSKKLCTRRLFRKMYLKVIFLLPNQHILVLYLKRTKNVIPQIITIYSIVQQFAVTFSIKY